MTTVLIIVVLFFVIVAVALAALKSKSGVGAQVSSGIPDAYYLRKSLFTPAERSFLGVLETLQYEGVGYAYKVRLADIFGIKKGLERADRTRALNKITSKHVDFLLVQKSDGKPILGIELDDSSHEEEERVSRDAFVDTFSSLPLCHCFIFRSSKLTTGMKFIDLSQFICQNRNPKKRLTRHWSQRSWLSRFVLRAARNAPAMIAAQFER